jgi:perosamine synthetase
VTLCVSPDEVDAAAQRHSGSGRLKAMIPMHYGGQMADMPRLSKTASRHGLKVIEDAAHALPAYLREQPDGRWQMVGSTSAFTCFSFYANKCITSAEGGMVAVHDPEMAERIRMMSLHGLSRSAWNRFENGNSWHYQIVEAGFKYNLTDLAAAIGVAQLRKAGEFWRRRRSVARAYGERLAAYDEFIELPRELPDRQSSWHLYPIRLRLEALAVDRAQVIGRLQERGITCSVHWMPLHLHPYYERRYGYQPADCPAASREWLRLISLPIYPSMTDEEIDFVCEALGAVLEQNARLQCAMAGD